jgi:hypothetical protein
MKLDYKRLIETGFDIIDKKGNRQKFILNLVQDKYLELLNNDYSDWEGIRENILKARKEGFSSLIDAIFTVDFLARSNIGAQIISHNDKETSILFNRVHFFVNSFCEKRGLDRKQILDTDQHNFLRNRQNGSFIFIGTAGAKILGRGPTLQNIHWSEVGFYSNTEILSAEKLIAGAEQQVATRVGKIFRESTGNMWGDYYWKECERARKGETPFKFRFFAWFEDPDNRLPVENIDFTPEEHNLMEKFNLDKAQIYWYRQKMKEFSTGVLGMREYPFTPEEAFLTSGSSFFDPEALKNYRDRIVMPIKVGNLVMDGDWL